MKEVQDKLAAAEEASKRAAEEAKKKARELKTAVGLARTVGPHVPVWVTHRGLGAFCVSDFATKPNTVESEQNKAEQDQESTQEGTTVGQNKNGESEKASTEGTTVEKSSAEESQKAREEETITDQNTCEKNQEVGKETTVEQGKTEEN